MTTIGQAAFAAYRATTQGVAYDGSPIPEWMLLKQSIRDAWEAAAYAVRVYDAAMRDRKEVEDRLNNLVKFLAHVTPIGDSTVRVHARALDLVWVLHPGMRFEEQRVHLDNLIQTQLKGDQP